MTIEEPKEPPAPVEEDLAEDVRDALAVLEDEDESSDIRDLLSSPEARQTVERMVMTAVSVIEERHSGPLPAPRQMREYEEIVPGGAERIFQMAEREQLQRHAVQNNDVQFREQAFNHVQKRESRGQGIAFVLCLIILGMGGVLIATGFPGLATTLIMATLVGIASVFLLGRGAKKTEPSVPPTSE